MRTTFPTRWIHVPKNIRPTIDPEDKKSIAYLAKKTALFSIESDKVDTEPGSAFLKSCDIRPTV